MGCTCNAETKENLNPNRKKDQNVVNNNNNITQDKTKLVNKNKELEDISTLDKEKCKSITQTLPKRIDTNLNSLKDTMKSKTDNLSQKEKSYINFLWICQNIDYDAEGYFAGRKVDCTPEGVFRNGKTVCSGYSRLYKNIGSYLGLNIECVSCYAKGVSYEPGQKMKSTNHEYNVINLNNKWYPIDSTWGAGHLEGRNYVREFNEFYYLANPELLIKTHFPADEKWQLTEKKYTLDDFLKWPEVKDKFNIFGFNRYSPEEGLITLTNVNTQKFIIWGDSMKQKGGSCTIYLLQGNCYNQQLNLHMINFYKDRFEVDCIFNIKGKYKLQIFGNNDGTSHYNQILGYTVNVENDSKKILKFPHPYSGSKDINIIEPLYDNLKHGEKVKFKIKSDLETLIILDKEWHYLNKNEEGYFEKEITIEKEVGKNLIVGKKTENDSCSYLMAYDIVK